MEKNEHGVALPKETAPSRCRGEDGVTGAQLAMVYAPYQEWRMLYSPEKALARGTLFEELDKPLGKLGGGAK